MKQILLLLILLMPIYCFPIKIDSLRNDKFNMKDLTAQDNKFEISDNLGVVNYSSSDDEKLADKMPWIVALIISILSFILNYLLTKITIKASSLNLEKQIQSTKDIAITDFKARLKTQNRQRWLDDLREDLSEYLAYSAISRAKLAEAESEKIAMNTFDIVGEEFKMMVKYKVKLLTKLNLQHPEQEIVAEKINLLFKKGFVSTKDFPASEHINLENELLADMRELVDIHWTKIKNIDE